MTLEEKDLPLLIALQENPLAPASKLAKALNQSTPTIISRLSILKESGSYYYISADLKPETLEMEIIDVIIQIEHYEDIKYFEDVICYHHPFTLFRIRCFGNGNGIYTQFRIPNNSLSKLRELLNYLQKNRQIQDYTIINVSPETKTIYTNTNLANWQPNLMRWIFDWDAWFKQLDNQPSKVLTNKPGESLLTQLDELDIALLEEITKDARRKNTEIMSSLKLDKNLTGLPQKISRKLKFLDKNIVFQYRVFLRWETFEIYNSYLIDCKCNKDLSYKFQNLLAKKAIPFQSTFKLTETGFFWYIRCPASHFSNISEMILKIADKTDFYFLDYKNSSTYGLWKNSFDYQNKKWLTDLMKIEEVIK